MSILKQYDRNALFPHEKAFRDDVILFVEGKKAFAEVFEGTGNPRDAPPGATSSRTVNRELVMAVAAELGRLNKIFYTPYIPEDKSKNARASTKMPTDEPMLVLIDNTFF